MRMLRPIPPTSAPLTADDAALNLNNVEISGNQNGMKNFLFLTYQMLLTHKISALIIEQK